jgi:hypothetical protein
MKAFVMFLAVAIGAVAAIAASQDAAAAAGKTTASGEIVRYDAGKAIVLRHADDRVVTYALSPTLIVPVEVQVGRRVFLVAEPGEDGVVRVTQLATIAADAAPSGGQIRQATTYPHDAKSEITRVYGVVTAYEPGRTITVTQPDRKRVIYSIDRDSALPSNVARGRRVVVSTITRPGLDRPLVRKVTVSSKKSG